MSIKLSLTAAAVSALLAGHAGAAVVITGWNTGNVAVSLKFPHHRPEFSCPINHLRWIQGLDF